MVQGTVNGRRTTRARHIEALERERNYGRLIAVLALIGGALIGMGITLMVQGVI
jgi:hypothetical protein